MIWDSNGVVRYEEPDLIGEVSDLLNIGMESVSTAVDLLRNEIVDSPTQIGVTPSSPWYTSTSYPIPTLVEANGMVALTSGMILRLGALTVAAGATHTFAAVNTGGLPHPLLPVQEAYGSGVVFANGTIPVPCYVSLSSTGALSFIPYASVTFGAGGGATNSIRIPTIVWQKP